MKIDGTREFMCDLLNKIEEGTKTPTEDFIDSHIHDFEGSPCNECEYQKEPYEFDECAKCTMERIDEKPSNYRKEESYD